MVTKELFFSKTSLPAVCKSLDASMLRSKAIAHNVANVETPGYRRAEVRFEDKLRKALDRTKLRGTTTHQRHLRLGRPRIKEVYPKSYRPEDPTLPSGVNNVDIDLENAKLAENQLLFNFAVKFAAERFKAINNSIKGRSQ